MIIISSHDLSPLVIIQTRNRINVLIIIISITWRPNHKPGFIFAGIIYFQTITTNWVGLPAPFSKILAFCAMPATGLTQASTEKVDDIKILSCETSRYFFSPVKIKGAAKLSSRYQRTIVPPAIGVTITIVSAHRYSNFSVIRFFKTGGIPS